MQHAENPTEDQARPADIECVRWRPWPCESCRGGSTGLDFLLRCLGSNSEVPDIARNEQIEWLKNWESTQLLQWIQECPHTEWSELYLPPLAEGSEHRVLFDGETSEVVKITWPGTYGDYYEIIEGRVSQFDSTPAEYLLRMHWWEQLFSTAPAPIGMTTERQILSRQKFIQGDPPSQDQVDMFLTHAALVAVRQSCWLWKKMEADSLFEIWVGDARADNFVSTQSGIIPIDIRIWGVSLDAGKNS